MNYSLFGCAWGKDTTDNKELCLFFIRYGNIHTTDTTN